MIETQLVQRDFDKRWEMIAKIRDYENSYEYVDEQGNKIVFVPEKWVTTGVYDFILEEAANG